MLISTATSTHVRRLPVDGEPPPTPSEGGPVDFSTIDSPGKAALLPALNGASLLVMLSALRAEAQWNVSLTSFQETTWNDATHGTVRCHGESSNSSKVSLSGEGTLGEVPIEETWTLDKDNGVVSIEGTIGYSHESLVLADSDDGTQHLDGTVGDVEVHEVLRRSDGHLLIDGTLNDVESHQALKVNEDAMPFEPPLTFNDVITVDGSLGNAPITLNADAVYPPHMPVVTYEERGAIGGTTLQGTHTLQISALPVAGQHRAPV